MDHKDLAACERALLELLAEEDPMGLVAIGAPRDEYGPEVPDLLKHPRPSPGQVQAVFLRWFGEGTGEVSRGAAVRISEGVARLQQQFLGG